MNRENDADGLYTTHCSPEKKNRRLAKLLDINDRKSIAYVKNDEVESYITLDELNRKAYQNDLPKISVGF